MREEVWFGLGVAAAIYLAGCIAAHPRLRSRSAPVLGTGTYGGHGSLGGKADRKGRGTSQGVRYLLWCVMYGPLISLLLGGLLGTVVLLSGRGVTDPSVMIIGATAVAATVALLRWGGPS